jgi:hypothetical protein
VETHEILEQTERIAASPQLQHSESLSNLLRYLVRQTVDHPFGSVKEHQIAVEVFHRPSDFDPRLDSTVRVQTSRLRNKLSEYYSGPGLDDLIILEIPKGSYSVLAKSKTNEPRRVADLESVEVPPALAARPLAPASNRWKLATVLLSVLLLTLMAWAFGSGLGMKREVIPALEPGLARFWQGIITSPDPTLVVFSNAEFVGRPETGLRYFQREHDDQTTISDHYTGVGEVLAVQQLSSLFTRLGQRFQVKRSRLLHWDDTKSRDLIFIGSPSENLSLRELPLNLEFRFETMASGPRKGDLAIRNMKPQAGEAQFYLGSKDLPITEDYAIVSLASRQGRQAILLMAGTTTFGTEAAVEFVSQSAGAEEILRRLNGSVRPFVGVVRTEVKGGVPVNTRLVAWREMPSVEK